MQGIDGQDFELPGRLDHGTDRVFVEEVDSAVSVDRGCRVIAPNALLPDEFARSGFETRGDAVIIHNEQKVTDEQGR